MEVKRPSVVPIKGPFEVVSFNHLNLTLKHFNMATMIILTPKCILEADLSHVEQGESGDFFMNESAGLFLWFIDWDLSPPTGGYSFVYNTFQIIIISFLCNILYFYILCYVSFFLFIYFFFDEFIIFERPHFDTISCHWFLGASSCSQRVCCYFRSSVIKCLPRAKHVSLLTALLWQQCVPSVVNSRHMTIGSAVLNVLWLACCLFGVA